MRALAACLLGLVLVTPAFAQVPSELPEDPEHEEASPFDTFAERFQTDEFQITTLLQVVSRVAFEETEGDQARFEIPRARLGFRGRFDNGIGYRLQTEFVRDISLLDGFVTYGIGHLGGSVGLQQTPFSAENIANDAATDFVERSRAVRQVSPGRSIGVQLIESPGVPLQLRAGVFNATQRAAVDGTVLDVRDRGGVLVMGRAQSTFDLPDGFVTLGANAAYITDDTSEALESPGELDLGVDARVEFGRFLVAGELLRTRTEDPFVATAPTGLDGGYATVGVDLTPADQLLTRLDVIAVEDGEASAHLLLGYNRTLTRTAIIQSNLQIPINDAQDGFDQPLQLLFNFQFAF